MIDLPLLPRPVAAVSITVNPQIRKIETSLAERAAIALTLDIVEIPALTAVLELYRGARGRIHVEGRIVADIVQSCVVSLEPVPQHIDEPISRLFFEGAAESADEPKPGSEIRVDLTEEDPPEHLTGSTLDLGGIVMEHLVLAMDPYPRAQGAELSGPEEGDATDLPESPFAILARLKEKPRGK